MPPAQVPRSNESNNVQTLPVTAKPAQQSLYQKWNQRMPSILDRANTSGCVVLAPLKSPYTNCGIMSLQSVPDVPNANPYIESVKYSFLGVTMGSIRPTSTHAGVVVSGVATALHCQPRSVSTPEDFASFLSVGCRVAFEFPSLNTEAMPGLKRTLGNGFQPVFDNDGIRIRRSYITESKEKQEEYVAKQIGAVDKDGKPDTTTDSIILWSNLAVACGLDRGLPATQQGREQIAYWAEKQLCFGQCLSNIKTPGETTAVRVLITPP